VIFVKWLRSYAFGSHAGDQVVPYKDASVLQAKLLKHNTLKIYPGFPHGLMTTHADVINADILAFIKGAAVKAA
jgi:pimeloyl-ACP methyl ester carboxylesterase